MRRLLFWAVLAAMHSVTPYDAAAQNSWWARYEARAAATTSRQPQWATPLVTTNARIEQGLRADFIRQVAPGGASTWNDGGSKGLQFIPFARTEIRFSPPPFFSHSDPRVLDGFGDVAFRLKYRAYGSNEQHHNAIVSLVLGATYPTGKQANGSCCAVLTPMLELGKGFDRLALTTTASGTLPVSNAKGLGRSIGFNNAIQYHVTKLLWVETEFNSTFYKGGRYDARAQTFTTPGIIVSRIPLRFAGPLKPAPLTLTLGAGEQIALTHFHTYDHAVILTGRLRF